MATYDITSGVTSTGLTLNGDVMNISSGGVAINTVGENSYIHVSNGGLAEKTTINSNGQMFLSSAGRANSVTLNSSGWLFVSSGGTVSNVLINSSGRMNLNPFGKAVRLHGRTRQLRRVQFALRRARHAGDGCACGRRFVRA